MKLSEHADKEKEKKEEIKKSLSKSVSGSSVNNICLVDIPISLFFPIFGYPTI